MAGDLSFEPRFSGPPGTVNGGFACGVIAGLCPGPAEVTLRRPVPVGRPLTVRDDGDVLLVLDGELPLAEARVEAAEREQAVPAISAELARSVAGRAAYYADPAFPGCFVCGPERAAGDGLRIFPGRVPGGPVWAAPWTADASVAAPDGRVRPEVVWAALDCPGGIAAGEAAELPEDTTALLGRMTVSIAERPRPGEVHRVVAWPAGRDGRRLTARTALLDPAGDVLATARSLWVTVPRPVSRPTAGAAR
jgi:hypothetical protein